MECNNIVNKLCFVAEWLDPEAGIVRHFIVSYYTQDGSIEMHNMGNRRIFLKRIRLEDLREKELYVGNTVMILSRKLVIVNYGDKITQQFMENRVQKNVIFMKLLLLPQLGKIMSELVKVDLDLVRLKLTSLSESSKQKLQEIIPSEMWNISGHLIAIEMKGEDINNKLSQVIGKYLSRKNIIEVTKKCIDNKDLFFFEDLETANLAAKVVFALPADRLQKDVCGTCCIIRPHAVYSGTFADVVTDITSSKFQISAMLTFHFDTSGAETFLDVYKGVVPEFQGMVNELASGLCIVLEITIPSLEDHWQIVPIFRQFVGPLDPEIARLIRPDSLRAKYGMNKVKNAVHCTDLQEDAELEIGFFFGKD